MFDTTTAQQARAMLHALLLLSFLALGGCASLSQGDQQSVAGKTYVITGASSGFGRGVALRLAGMKANVVLAARRTEVLNQVAAQAQAAGGSALVVTTDVSKAEDVRRLADAAVQRFGRIDVWINNAAVGAIGAFDSVPVEDHARVVDVNLKGVIYGSHVALQQFRKQGAGVLVNLGSVESEVPLAYHASYSATKAAILALGRALNEELRLAGLRGPIDVATVMPWATDTPFFDHAANYTGRTARMPAMDPADKVVDYIVYASLHPSEEVPTGWKARGAVWSHHLAPDLTERISANIAHKSQMEKAPPTLPPTSGSLYQPMPAGTGVDGGVRARMEREDAARKER
ncbi:SDR family oxidoreductase [Herbaspirillum sp. SJZ107]|uniref:SDR family NAD(P)-dependent oxidoreductase n=1 Tax=Herbaspirillum sp. SJZ107 TaxID=2572881 RepID=UPI00114ED533|nr:SDR family NAD(P)-dependent oxidoreductase [Herbaspirillum sp. SJZ107]TQK10333.1 short-subunit dehydrogenase [Herbaspirillum sp. SJZ107]